VDPSAVPLLEKPNPVSKQMAFYKCDFNNDDSAFGVVTIT